MLSTDQIIRIKEALSQGFPQKTIAATHRVSRSLVSDIATGRVHGKVGPVLPRKKAGGQGVKYDPTDTRIVELEEEIVHLTD